jgi:hypothetical protein
VIYRKYQHPHESVLKHHREWQLLFPKDVIVPNVHIFGFRSVVGLYFEKTVVLFSADLNDILIHLELSKRI